MTKEQAAAYVFSRAVAALVCLEACKAANAERTSQGYALAYGESALADITDEHGISHNAVMALFAEAA